MSRLTRREFLLSLAALPFLKVALPALDVPGTLSSAGQASDLPNILLIVFDAFSARHISLHGYERQTTPNLARLADRATVFHNHYAGGNFTSPATATLLMGLYPWKHRTYQHYGHALSSLSEHNVFSLLPDAYHKVAYTHNPLASALLHQFQRTIDQLSPRNEHALVDGLWSDLYFPKDYPVAIQAERVLSGERGQIPGAAAFTRLIGLLRKRADSIGSMEKFAEMFPRGVPFGGYDSRFLLEDITDWIAELSTTAPDPHFMYIHMLPPHGPYATRREFVDIFDDGWQPVEKAKNPFEDNGFDQAKLNQSRRMYDEFIAYVDAEFGRLMDSLEKSGRLDNTYVIMTSDHGEIFERGIVGHSGMTLYDGIIHIPLMIWKPGQQQRQDVHERTTAVDIMPTVLHLAGQPIPATCEGTVLPTFVAPSAESRTLYSVEAKENKASNPLTIGTVACYQGPYKLIQYMGYDGVPTEGYYELFNLENDPEELENLYNSERGMARDMTALMRDKLEEVNRAPVRA